MSTSSIKIKYLATCKGITEKELLKAAGLNSNYLSQKRKNNNNYSIISATKIAGVLKCDISDLAGEIPATITFNAAEVRQRAALKGYTERDLLKAAGLSPCMLSKARREKSLPTPQTLAKIAGVLKCDISDLIIYEEAINSEGVEICKE